jgi:CubicO group peptidase (beta-lactamase class C family)
MRSVATSSADQVAPRGVLRFGMWKLVAILTSLVALSGRSVAADDAVAKTVDTYLVAREQMGQFSGAVLVAKSGHVILRKGYGYADVERRIPYRPETKHEVASLSKMFTALAALKLRDQGKLALDDSVCAYLADCPESWRAVTVRHLIQHRSGIPDYEERDGIGTEKYFELMTPAGASARILARAKTDALDFSPGSKFHYSNTGYIVLGYVLERASGVSFAKLVTETVLKPAGMRSSGVLGTGSRPKDLAMGYTSGDVGWTALLHGVSLTDGHLHRVAPLALTPPEGDAWLYSTVDDLYRFSREMEGSALIPAALVAEIAAGDEDGYGAGWFISQAFARTRMRHNGSLPGYVSDFIRFPDEKTTIILFSNLDRTRLDRIARDVTAIVVGTSFDMPVHGDVITLDEAQIARLTGDYATEDGRTLNVRKEPDYLTAELKGQYTAGLIPLSPTEMYFPLGDGKALFTIGADGRATQVNMRYGGEDHVAKRVPPS